MDALRVLVGNLNISPLGEIMKLGRIGVFFAKAADKDILLHN